MLDVLRRIVQEVSDASDLDEALKIIVARVKEATSVDLCSVYLTDHTHKQNVLMSTDGLNPDIVGELRLNLDQGLIGLVGRRKEVVNVADGSGHPDYHYVPQSGEDCYHAFLGVPIIHARKLLGVLVLQRYTRGEFKEDIVTFLITVAAQLAGAIAHADASGGINGLAGKSVRRAAPYLGQPGSPGIGVGQAYVVYPSADIEAIPDRLIEDADAEIEIFNTALSAVRLDIKAMLDRLKKILPAEDRALFEAYLLMLDSDTLVNGVIERIRAGNWASGALRDTIREHLRIFDAMEDPYLRERGTDILDLGRRILKRLQTGGEERARVYPDKTILVGFQITASMLAEVPSSQIVGVISTSGSRTSHVAILSRAMGIPAVMGADIPVGKIDARNIIVDGYRGQVYIEPKRAIQEEFKRLAKEEQELSDDLAVLQDLPSKTPDGVHIPLHINSGLLAGVIPPEASNAEGIGLYRTEFPFMIRDTFPGEDEQFHIYREVLQAFKNGPVILRTLDVGGDKALPYFPITEDNPFLGWRGIRITLDHPEIFLVQLRAMLRANEGMENMQLMLPMVSCIREVDDSILLIKIAYEELLEEGYEIKFPKIGVMIEVPSAVYQVREISEKVDFVSVGTNDLIQYLLAVDRNNARVADLYESLHPAVLRALQQIVQGAHAANIPAYVCGEMAGDPAAAILLMAMEYDCLSMSVSNLPRIKWVIRNYTISRAKRILDEVFQFDDALPIRNHLNSILENSGLGGLVRAGR